MKDLNLNISKNDIRDVSMIKHMQHLTQFQASTNQVSSIMFLETECDILPFLQVSQTFVTIFLDFRYVK